MNSQSYSQVVGEPIVNTDIEKIVESNIEIENYDDIENIDFKYNDTSIIKPLLNKIFELTIQFNQQTSYTNLQKFLAFKIKNDFNKKYNYECISTKNMFKVSCKFDKTNIIFDYDTKTKSVRIISFNKNKFTSSNDIINVKDVKKITEMTDGTTIYVVFNTLKNKWFLSTNKSLEGNSNYDLPETHKQIFLNECKKRGYDFNKLLKYLVTNKKDTHVLLFSMRHYISPIPLTTKENILKFINVYCVSNKVEEYDNYNTKFNEYKKSNFANEELKEEIYSIINSINDNLINYLDAKKFASFCEKSKIGKFVLFDEYKFNPEKNIKQQLDSYMRKCNYTFKGFMVVMNDKIICYENEEYNKIYYYRPKFSLNDQDNILYKLFMFQLECLFEKDKDIFFEYYSDLVKLYDIETIFATNKEKVYEFYSAILKWYKLVFVEKSKTENDIPYAYKYCGGKYNFPRLLSSTIYMMNKNYQFDINSEDDKKQLYRKLVIEKLLKDYYIQTKNRETCRYGSLFNNIFKPILTKNKTDFKDL